MLFDIDTRLLIVKLHNSFLSFLNSFETTPSHHLLDFDYVQMGISVYAYAAVVPENIIILMCPLSLISFLSLFFYSVSMQCLNVLLLMLHPLWLFLKGLFCSMNSKMLIIALKLVFCPYLLHYHRHHHHRSSSNIFVSFHFSASAAASCRLKTVEWVKVYVCAYVRQYLYMELMFDATKKVNYRW